MIRVDFTTFMYNSEEKKISMRKLNTFIELATYIAHG